MRKPSANLGSDGSFGRNATVLALALAGAGVLNYLFFGIATRALEAAEYGDVVVLWAASFAASLTLFRPVEQILARDLAAARLPTGQVLGDALRLQLALAAAFAITGIALRDPLADLLFGGETAYCWALIATGLTYAVSFFARGVLAGSNDFRGYAFLLAVEAGARVVLVALALGALVNPSLLAGMAIAAAPLVGVGAVLPALARRLHGEPRRSDSSGGLESGEQGLSPAPLGAVPAPRSGTGFAAALVLIVAAEQVLFVAAPLLLRSTEGAVAAGAAFNLLLVARAPVLIFHGVAASLLPHLSRLRWASGEDSAETVDSLRLTLIGIAVFTAVASLVLAAVGPGLMRLAFETTVAYTRADLLGIALGSGLFLVSMALTQAAIAHGRAAIASVGWVLAAASAVPIVLAWRSEPLHATAVAFLVPSAILAAMLAWADRRERANPTGPRPNGRL